MANEKNQTENQEEVKVARTSAAQWIEKNATWISWTILGILVVICGIIALNKYVFEPKGIEAANETAKAVVYFEQGNFQSALEGDDAECLGFAAIASKYARYQEGKLASLYAGICEYQLGNYEDAAKALKKFDADDLNISPAAKLLLGNAYVELQEYAKAAKAFKEAADSENEIIAPVALKKLGLVYLEQDNAQKAVDAFEKIKNDYPLSVEAQDIDKYISRYAE